MLNSWKGESESKIVSPAEQVVVHHELPQLVRHEVEQVHPRTCHQLLADCMLHGSHPHTGALGVQADENHPEVCSSKIQRQELSCFSASWQLGDVGDVGLDVGAWVGVPAKTPVDLHDHPLLYVLQLHITGTFQKSLLIIGNISQCLSIDLSFV